MTGGLGVAATAGRSAVRGLAREVEPSVHSPLSWVTDATDTVFYEIWVENLGPAPATGVVVGDELPCDFVADDCGGDPGPPWTWDIGDLAVGESAHCEIECDVSGIPAGTVIENVATVSADQTNTGDQTSNTVATRIGTVLEIPTLGYLGLLVLIVSLLGAGIDRLRRRR